MSYLLQLVRRRDPVAPHIPVARVDEHARLNRAGLYGDAFVHVYVEDTSAFAPRRRHREHPVLILEIADCMNTIALEFSLSTAELRDNSLFKIDTLLGALQRFRDALAAEAELAARH